VVKPFLESGGRVCIFNTWRRFDADGWRSPLALCRPPSIEFGDLVASDAGMRTQGGPGGAARPPWPRDRIAFQPASH
jgi:hypothetical protein